MPNLIKRSCLLLCALPVVALADPITVVTHSTGIASGHPTVLYALGYDYTGDTYDLPYELTITSTFDWTGPLPARDKWATDYSGPVEVDFHIGDFDYHYAGTEWTDAIVYTPYGHGDGYQHQTWVNPYPGTYGYSFSFTQMLFGPAGSLGPGGALDPRVVGSANADGYLDLTAYYSNDEYTFSWSMSGDIDTYSVQVTSPVPEPASFGVLATGLLVLGLRRRFSSSIR